jgi:hypothetical protein
VHPHLLNIHANRASTHIDYPRQLSNHTILTSTSSQHPHYLSIHTAQEFIHLEKYRTIKKKQKQKPLVSYKFKLNYEAREIQKHNYKNTETMLASRKPKKKIIL